MVSYNNNFKKYIGTGLIVASFIAMAIMLMQTGTNDIWYDEVFSVCFARMGIRELITMTARDVHPPFYYIYLKAVTGALCSIFGNEYFVTISKLASAVPWGALAVMSLTFIRKRWGYFVSGLFLFLVTLMPQISNYYVEIRMYSFAMIFVTLCFFAAYQIVDSNRIIFWILFWISGIITAYTQYYACIGIVGIYIGLFSVILISKKDNYKKQLIYLAICIALSVVAYIPWLPVLFKQMANINGNYWIQPLTLRSIAGCVKFIVLPVADRQWLCYVAAGLVVAATAIAIFVYIKKEFKVAITDGIICLAPLMTIIISGFVLSAIGTPIFVYRYMIPVLGIMWLYVAIAVDKMSEKALAVVLMLVPFILAGILTCRGFYLEEHKKVTHMPLVNEAFEKIPDNSVIISNFDHVAAISGYYLKEDDVFLYESDIDPIISDMMNGCGGNIKDADIVRMLLEGRRVYFFGSFNSREDIIADWNDINIIATKEDSILLERYWFNIYRLELNEN